MMTLQPDQVQRVHDLEFDLVTLPRQRTSHTPSHEASAGDGTSVYQWRHLISSGAIYCLPLPVVIEADIRHNNIGRICLGKKGHFDLNQYKREHVYQWSETSLLRS